MADTREETVRLGRALDRDVADLEQALRVERDLRAQDPGQQIKLFEMMGNGPANPEAAKMVPEDMRQYDPGQPENLALQVPFNGKWYQEEYSSGKTNDQITREKWLEVQAG